MKENTWKYYLLRVRELWRDPTTLAAFDDRLEDSPRFCEPLRRVGTDTAKIDVPS